jgi:hypothetical protein
VLCKRADHAPGAGRFPREATLVAAYRGRIAFVPRVAGLSTSETVRRLHDAA